MLDTKFSKNQQQLINDIADLTIRVNKNKKRLDTRFEKMEKKELIVFDTNTIEKAYLSAARYYFNKGNKSKAKEYLNNGLKYAPDSTILKEKLNLVK